MADILVVDDDVSLATAFERFLDYEGHGVRIATGADEGIRLIEERQPNIVFMDVRMPRRDGLAALQTIRVRFPQVYVVMMTAYGTSQTSIEAIRAGAFDYLTKPLDLDTLREMIAKALAAQQVRDAFGSPSEDHHAAGVRLIGETPEILKLYKMIGRLATNDVPALILGERGTGKELVARTIHENSRRSSEPFVTVDCDSMGVPILEDSVFATGGGSVFIGAIERMPSVLQARLARVLTTGPPAGSAGHPRVVAASARDLGEAVRAGLLRRDLYDVLSTISIRLPPLRERSNDIALLVRHFIHRLNDELKRTLRGVDDEVWRRLVEHTWPGNVGELERVVTRACVVARGDVITMDDIGDGLTASPFEHRDGRTTLRAKRSALSGEPLRSPRGQPRDAAQAELGGEVSNRKWWTFLCHSSGDKAAVRELHRKLARDGFEPWLDEKNLLPGEDWDTEIRRAIRESHAVIVCLSSASTTKAGYVQKEIKVALDVADEQPPGTIFIIPVRLSDCTVPERLKKWQWVDLFRPRGYQKLVEALSTAAGI